MEFFQRFFLHAPIFGDQRLLFHIGYCFGYILTQFSDSGHLGSCLLLMPYHIAEQQYDLLKHHTLTVRSEEEFMSS